LCPAILDLANQKYGFVAGEDFKTGQTKLKSVIVDFLASSGIKPLSIVSYNHLGNNDGLNLNENSQFISKEITKKNVIDDIIDENPELFKGKNPDHCVVIKYVPSVGDSKRAMDEYYSELCLDGRSTIAIHNTCEDSLLAVPLMLDIILFGEFFSRVKITENNKIYNFSPNLKLLSLFFKAPVDDGTPIINAFFKQRYALENFIKICNGIPINDFVNL
jgi:myo-inositol-1-phosphate synthase